MRSSCVVSLTLILSTCIGVDARAHEEPDKLKISVVVDAESLEGKDKQIIAAWVGYAMARANWISEHYKTDRASAKWYSRTLDEEAAGRESLAQIWSEFKVKQPRLRDRYLDHLQKVKEAGFLREYVWANLRDPEWKAQPAGLRLERYAEWAKVNLAGHVVQTHADVRIESP
jgi:hypothetical protein